jgi:curved DNA-binding protein CbpA
MVGGRRSGGEDLYRRLDLPADASPAEISRAYRRLAQVSHPDARPDDADAPRRFLAITEAYEILSDPQRRARYDRGQPKTPNPRPGPVDRAKPGRPDVPPTIIVVTPTTRMGATIIADASIRASTRPPLVVGPLHWQPQPDSPLRPAPAADPDTLLVALQQLGWW